jgi:hypothetical protein
MRLICWVAVSLLVSGVDGMAQSTRPTPAQRRSYSDSVARIRLGYLDSLAAARRKWLEARVVEYDIQAHGDCYCFRSPNDTGLTLAQQIHRVRDRRIVASRPGKSVSHVPVPIVVESLFVHVESMLRSNGVIVRNLIFHPEFGAPMRLYTDYDSNLSHGDFDLIVDLFEVRRRRPLSPRTP